MNRGIGAAAAPVVCLCAMACVANGSDPPACSGSCAGHMCGEVCGESCGTCSSGFECNDQGFCVRDAMVLVPPGTFWMGCNDTTGVDGDCEADEYPQVELTLSAYEIDVFEVTLDSYNDCWWSGVCPARMGVSEFACKYISSGEYAVCGVDRVGADAYCKWMDKSLPSEAQWEKAARGGCELYPGEDCRTAMPRFPWGNAGPTCELAYYYECTEAYFDGSQWPWPNFVGQLPAGASPYGVLDMAGNVAELVSDDYHETLDGTPADGSPWKVAGGSGNATRRGGSYFPSTSGLRTSARQETPLVWINASNQDQGFRCARKVCFPSCAGKACGPDGCGGSCGACEGAEVCVDGACAVCTPSCTGKVCGDGCGGYCGDCPADALCNHAGFCEKDGMVAVPTGTFEMGCNAALDSDCEADEVPQHAVAVPAFAIDIRETTVAEYWACQQAGACKRPWSYGTGQAWTDFYSNGTHGDRPITCLRWKDAWDYCQWKGKALPTEAQWEKAARGGCDLYAGAGCDQATPKYPWGPSAATCERAVMASSAGPACGVKGAWTFPWTVGSRIDGASPYGVFDLAGNVAEWVLDNYHSSYVGAPGDGKWWSGPDYYARVSRGGTFADGAAALRASNRTNTKGDVGVCDVGFRCVVPVP